MRQSVFVPLIAVSALSLLSGSALAQTEASLPSGPPVQTEKVTAPPADTLDDGTVRDSGGLVLSRSAGDQRLRDSLKFCGGLENHSERLACYERAADQAGLPIWKDKDGEKENHWVYHENVNGNDYEAFTTLNSPNGSIKSQLYIRCHQGKMELYEKWPLPVGSRNINVSVGPDKKYQASYEFKPSISGYSMGMWESHDATTLAKYLVTMRTGLIYFTAHFADGDDVSAFHLDGIEKAILGVRRSCNW